MRLTAGTRLGAYEILAPLGSGGMGEVYRARDTRLERLVAIKVLSEALVSSAVAGERFQNEARAVAAIDHPNICTVFDVGMGSPTEPQFIAMELLEGETLQQRLSRGPFPLPALVETALPIAEGLAAAHARGIIHRDIKPSNIFLTPRGPKILDFGMARFASPSAHLMSSHPTRSVQAQLTEPGMAAGTIAYMSPEQLRAGELDARTDLFSLGGVLYEMATGQRAFMGDTSAVIVSAILHDEPRVPHSIRPDLPPGLEDLILRLLEKDVGRRFQTAADLCAQFKWFGRELPPTRALGSAPIEQKASRPRWSRRALLVAAPVALTVGLVSYLITTDAVTIHLPGFSRTASPQPDIPANRDLDIVTLMTTDSAPQPSVSFDGEMIAYIRTDQGHTSLWVRSTADAGDRQIAAAPPGTRLLAPTFTRDGRYIGYVQQDVDATDRMSLWQVALTGGTATLLVDRVSSAVGWSGSGERMAFVRRDVVGLVGQGGSRRDVVMTALVVADADGRNEQTLATREAPNRFFNFEDDGAAIAHRPSWSRTDTGIAVAGELETLQAASGVRAEEIHVSVQAVLVDIASLSQRAIDVHVSGPLSLAWPGHRLIVSGSQEMGQPSRLSRLTPDIPIDLGHLRESRRLEALKTDAATYEGVSATGDGAVAVTTRREWIGQLRVSEADGSDGADVPDTHGTDRAVTWVGDRVLYTTSAHNTWSIVSTGARSAAQELSIWGSTAAATSDGRTIVFAKLEADSGAGVWTTDVSRLDFGLRLAPAPAIMPSITPDNRDVVFLSSSHGVLSPWMVPLFLPNASPREMVKRSAVATVVPRVSPDNRLLLFGVADARETCVVMVCDLPDCRRPQTVSIAGSARSVTWARDSQGIAYLDRSRTNIWIQPRAGGSPRQLTRFADGKEIGAFAWSHDGKRLAMTRGTATTTIVLVKGLESH